MRIVVIADESQRMELGPGNVSESVTVEYSSEIGKATDADVCIDLLFENTQQRINKLTDLDVPLIIVNAVSVKNVPDQFVRINGWPTLLKRSVVEAATRQTGNAAETEKVFGYFNRTIEWVPSNSGMITPRIICMIINEAFFALGENISSREEIDTAMKLGTNYPYGPFEWSEKIGADKIYNLLAELSQSEPRYLPAPLLKEQALSI